MAKFFELDNRLSRQLRDVGALTFSFWDFLARFGALSFVLVAAVAIGLQLLDGWHFVLSVFGSVFVAIGLQRLIRRPRPNVKRRSGYLLAWRSYAFPSVHSTVSATCASLLTFFVRYGDPQFHLIIGLLMFVLAGLIGLSRVAVGVHRMVDVIAGLLLGTFLSFILP